MRLTLRVGLEALAAAAAQRSGNGVSKTIPGSAGALSQALFASSDSSCPASQPAYPSATSAGCGPCP